VILKGYIDMENQEEATGASKSRVPHLPEIGVKADD